MERDKDLALLNIPDLRRKLDPAEARGDEGQITVFDVGVPGILTIDLNKGVASGLGQSRIPRCLRASMKVMSKAPRRESKGIFIIWSVRRRAVMTGL